MVGSEETRQYGIFGDTVNIAARLQAQAKASQIVISATAYGQLKTAPQLRHLQDTELILKGKTHPLKAYIIHP